MATVVKGPDATSRRPASTTDHSKGAFRGAIFTAKRSLAPEARAFGRLMRQLAQSLWLCKGTMRSLALTWEDAREEFSALGRMVSNVFNHTWAFWPYALANLGFNASLRLLGVALTVTSGWIVTAINDELPYVAIASIVLLNGMICQVVMDGPGPFVRDWLWGRMARARILSHLALFSKARLDAMKAEGLAIPPTVEMIILRGREWTTELLEIFTREVVAFVVGVGILVTIALDYPMLGIGIAAMICIELWVSYIIFSTLRQVWKVRQGQENRYNVTEIEYAKHLQGHSTVPVSDARYRMRLRRYELANKFAFGAQAFYQYGVRGTLIAVFKCVSALIIAKWAAEGTIDSGAFVILIGLVAQANDPVMTIVNVQKRVIETRDALERFADLVGCERLHKALRP